MNKKHLIIIFLSVFILSAETVKHVYHFISSPTNTLKSCKLLLPRGTQAKSVSVEYKNPVEVPEGRIYDNFIYHKSVKTTGHSHRTQFLNGIPICITTINPVQYDPVKKKPCYYKKVIVSVETEPVNLSRNVAPYVFTPFIRSKLQFTVDNPEAICNLQLTPKDSTDYEFLIITFSEVESTWDDYIAFNKRRGLRTKVALISEVLQTSGTDDAEKVRNYIKNQYENHKIMFVVLGGDVENIPYRKLYSESYDHNPTPDRLMKKFTGSDMYFGTLDGNWNNDNDTLFGEVGEEDLFWEVYVSRIPVDSVPQLENVIMKTVHYSETPHRDQVNNVLMASVFLWDDYGYTVWGADNIEYFVGYKNAYGWQTYGLPKSKFDISWLTDKETGAANGWDSEELKEKILSDKPSWIDYGEQNGHGSATRFMSMNSDQIATYLTNTGSSQNYFIFISGGGNPGLFKAKDCFMETFFYLDKGTVATISNWESGIGDDDDNNSPSCVPLRFVHDALFNPDKRVHFLEAMHAMGKEALVSVSSDPDAITIAPYYGLLRYVSYNTNLFGDPALSVWTDTPKDITGSTFEVVANRDKFTMKTPPYTSVALADVSTGEIVTTQLTGYKYNANASFVVGDSTCFIDDSQYKDYAASNNKVKVIVKAHNYIAGEFEVDINDVGIHTAGAKTGPLSDFSVQSVNGKTLITFALANNEMVNVSLFNVKGALVKTLINRRVNQGVKEQVLCVHDELGSGLYYCRIKTKSLQRAESFIIIE